MPSLPPLPAPTMLDRLVGYVSPRAGVDRLRARAHLSFMRGAYTGASSTKRSMKEWFPGSSSADAESFPDLPTLRARSSDLVKNAPIATGALNTVVTSTIGTGLTPWPRIDRELLGLSEEAADKWERQAVRLWRAWAASKACDVTRRNDFAGLTQIVLRGAWTRGDIFAVRRFIERPGDVLGTRLQLVEADRVSNPNWQQDTDQLRGGVALDQDGAPRGYFVRNRHPGEYGLTIGGDVWEQIPAFGARGNPLVFHVFRGERPDQTRGVPALASVIETLKELDRYKEAELAAAVIAAFFTVFVKTEGGEEGAGIGKLNPDAPGEASRPAHELALSPAAIMDLAPGESIEIANPGRPNVQFDPFTLAVLRQVGVAIELPYELLVKHFTSSYSASRAAIIEAWRSTLTRRAWVVRDFCQPAYESVVAEGVMRGYLAAPGFFEEPLVRQAYCGSKWTGPAMGQLNPADEANAAETRLRIGVSTLQEETAEMTGGDWEQNHPQQAKERKMREAAGLLETSTPAGDPASETAADRRDRKDREEANRVA